MSAQGLPAIALPGIVQIDEVVVGAAVPSVTFGPLDPRYKELWIRFLARSDFAGVEVALQVRLNGDTGANYDYMGANYTSNGGATVVGAAGATTAQLGMLSAGTATAGAAGHGTLRFPHYADARFRKGFHGDASRDHDGTNGRRDVMAGSWRNAAPITSITLLPGGGNFAAGSTFTLYGVA